ncbi:MAG: hypothetical protein WBA63_03530 [Thermomicrobiales bacterium]
MPPSVSHRRQYAFLRDFRSYPQPGRPDLPRPVVHPGTTSAPSIAEGGEKVTTRAWDGLQQSGRNERRPIANAAQPSVGEPMIPKETLTPS